jgi:hypothetical protein
MDSVVAAGQDRCTLRLDPWASSRRGHDQFQIVVRSVTGALAVDEVTVRKIYDVCDVWISAIERTLTLLELLERDLRHRRWSSRSIVRRAQPAAQPAKSSPKLLRQGPVGMMLDSALSV